MEKNNLLSISKFARIAGVSRQTLIYYDKIDLFKPVIVYDNKYRMYSHNQIQLIVIITILTSLKLSLKEIKKIIHFSTIDTMIETLKIQSNVINNEINKLSLLKNMLDTRLLQLTNGQNVLEKKPNISLIELKENIFYYFDKKIASNLITEDTMSDFFKSCENKQIPLIFSQVNKKSKDNILNYKYDIIDNFGFKTDDIKLQNYSLNKGKYLIAYAYGDYGTTNYIYDDILKYIKQNNYQIDSDFIEEYLLDELSRKKPNEYVLKIIVKIV